MASRGDTQSLRLIQFADSATTPDIVTPGNFTLSANSGSLYFNGTQVNTGSNNFAVISTNLIVPQGTDPSVTIGSNLILRQLSTTNYQSGQGFQYLSDGRLFFEGVEFGGRTNILPVVTSNIVTSQTGYLSINANVGILNTINVSSSNLTLRSNLVFSTQDPEIQFDSGSLSIRPLSSAGVLKIYGSSDKANVWLVSNDAGNSQGTDVANFSFVATGDTTSSTNKHAIAKISVRQTNQLSASGGGGLITLSSRDPSKPATTDTGDSDTQVILFSGNTTSSGNLISLGPGGDVDNVYVGIGTSAPTSKFQVYSQNKSFFEVDTVNSRATLGSGVALNFVGPITISGATATKMQIGTTGAGEESTSLGVTAGAAGSQAVAIGQEAGKTDQGSNTVSIGYRAGLTSQSGNAVSIGQIAGASTQGYAAVAIGTRSGESNQGSASIAIGEFSGQSTQGINAVALGYQAAQLSQGSGAVALGYTAGQTSQSANTVALGFRAGQSLQSGNAVAVGSFAGQTSQGFASIAIGALAGQSRQAEKSTAMGEFAGQFGQNAHALAFGHRAGQVAQGANSISIGHLAGQNVQSANAISIGYQAGQNNQSSFAISIGHMAGRSFQAASTVAIGNMAGNYLQKAGSVSVGAQAGTNSQGVFAVAVGYGAGSNLQFSNSIAIGLLAGSNIQQSGAVAIGSQSGFSFQGSQAISIGELAGETSQGFLSVALGAQAGQSEQQRQSVAVGANSGMSIQGSQSVAIGTNSGMYNQSVGSIAIGYKAAQTRHGLYSIAVGYQTGADDPFPDQSIMLNATGGSFVPYNSRSFNVRPVRSSPGEVSGNVLSYVEGTGEIYTQGLIFTGFNGVGIANGNPGSLLAIGTRTYFEESSTSNAIVTVGNVSANSYFGYGGNLSNTAGISTTGVHGSAIRIPIITVDEYGKIASISNVASEYSGTLQQTVNNGNTTSNTILFTNSTMSFTSVGPASIANTTPTSDSLLSIGNSTRFVDSQSNTIITTGNVSANYYYGNAFFSRWTTSVAPGTYGTSRTVPQIIVDGNGRISTITPLSVIANVTLDQVLSEASGNVSTKAISLTGPIGLLSSGNVGIGNVSPSNLLCIGANTFFTEFGSNTMVTRGNVSARVGHFTSLRTTDNVGIGNTNPSNLLSIGTKTVFNDSGSNTGMITTGNVTANYYYGSALFLSNVAGSTAAATYGQTSNMPQIVVDSSGRINSIVSAPVVLTLDQVVGYGRSTSNVVFLSNTGGSALITTGNVGIGNTFPSNLLSIGTKTVFNEDGGNPGMVTTGNVTATFFYGSALYASNVAGATTAATYGQTSNMPRIVVDSSGRISSIVSAPVVLTLDQVVGYGRTTSNIISLSNTGGSSLVTTGNVGIGNTNPLSLLSIGTKTVFNDSGINTGMVTTGNVTANYFYGSALFTTNVAGSTTAGTYGTGSEMAKIVVDSSGRITSIVTQPVSATLNQIVGYGNTTSNTVQFTNPINSLVTSGNVGIGNLNPSNLLSIGTKTVFNESGSNTGMVTTGNVTANNYYGNAAFLTGLTDASNASYGNGFWMPQITVSPFGRIVAIQNTQVQVKLSDVVNFGNTTANTVQFTNAVNSLVTSGNVGIGNANPSNLLCIGVNTRFTDTGANTGMVTTGNVTANHYYGSALFMSNVAGVTTAATYGQTSNMPRIVVDSSGRISGITSTPVVLTLDQVVGYGQSTSNIINLTNTGGTSMITTGNVGIGNSNPLNLVSIGTKTIFNDSGSNTGMVTTGNVTANYYYGSALFMSNVAGVTAAGTYGSTATIPSINVDPSGRVTSITNNQLALTLDQVANFGNSTSNALLLTGATTSLITTGNVAIGNSFGTSNTLTVGSNLWVRDTGSNVLFVNGNIFTTSLKTSGNVGIGNVVPSNLLCIGSSTYFTDDNTSNIMVSSGNVSVNYYHGNAWNLRWTTNAVPATYGSGTSVPQIVIDENGRVSNIISIPLGQGGQNLNQVVNTDNVTSNTLLLTNASNALVATGNVFAANFRLTSSSVQLGLEAATIGQNISSVAIGTQAGQEGQYSNAVAVGVYAGQSNQESGTVAVGEFAGQLNQNTYAIAIGSEAGRSGQYEAAISIGDTAGTSNQRSAAIAIGQQAGQILQDVYSVAIGYNASRINQGSSAISIGQNAGNQYQGSSAIAVGGASGADTQGSSAVAIGLNAGNYYQISNAVAIGAYSGYQNQNNHSIAIGTFAGSSFQGSYSIAIGAFAGRTSQASNSIVLNASGTALNTTVANTFVVNPVRFTPTTLSNIMVYTTSTSEISRTGWTQSTNGDLILGGKSLYGVIAGANTISGTNLTLTGTALGATSVSASTAFFGSVRGNASNILCGTVFGPISAGNTISGTSLTLTGAISGATSVGCTSLVSSGAISGTNLTLTGTALGATSVSASTGFFGSVRGNASNILCGTVFGPIAAGNTISGTSLTLTGAISGATSVGCTSLVSSGAISGTTLALNGTISGATSVGCTSLVSSGAISGTSLALNGTATGATRVAASQGFYGAVVGSNTISGSSLSLNGTALGATSVAASSAFYGIIAGSNTISGASIYGDSLSCTSYVKGDICVGYQRYTSATTVNISSGTAYQSYLLAASSTITVNLNDLGYIYDGAVIYIRSRGQRFNLAPASGLTYYDISNSPYTFPSSEGFPNSRNATILYSVVGPAWYLISYQ